MKRKNVIISALVLAIALTGCSGKKVDYNMETENINTKAGSDISAFDDSTKWNDSFSVEISDKSVDVDISADITLPDCKSMSVVEVKNIKVGADFKKSVIEAYFGYSTVYYHDIPHYTKEEIYHSMEVVKNEIAGYQQEIDAGLITEEGVSRVMKSENDLLEQYEKAEPSALDTREKAIRIVMSIWDILVMFSVSLDLELLRTALLNIFQHSLLRQEVRGHYTMIVSMAITDHHPLQRRKV